MRSTGKSISALRLFDGADGVKGHFCIGRQIVGDGIIYNEYWNKNRFCSAGEVFIGEAKAEDKLRELTVIQQLTDLYGSRIAKLMYEYGEKKYRSGKAIGLIMKP